MKIKNLISIAVCAIAGLYLASCSQTTNKPRLAPETTQVDQSIPWLYANFNMFQLKKIKDSISFYNSAEITLVGTFTNQSVAFQDGSVFVVDSVNKVSKIVVQMTQGKLIEVAQRNSAMKVSFSKGEATYTFIFAKRADGTYGLDPKNAALFFHGKKYPATAVSSGDCILKFYLTQKQETNEIKEQAEGVKP